MTSCWRGVRLHHLDLQDVSYSLLRTSRASSFLARCRTTSDFRGKRRIATLHAEQGDDHIEVNRVSQAVDGGVAALPTEIRHAHAEHLAEQKDVPASELDPPGPPQVSDSQIPPRLARKLRRQRDGTYKPWTRAAEEKAEQIEAENVEMMLDRLQKLEGPQQWDENPILSIDGPERRISEDNTRHRKALADNKQQKAKKDRILDDIAKGVTNGDAKPKKERWRLQKDALEHKFGESGWKPRKRLSPDTVEGIRAMHASNPVIYKTETLATHFKVSPEAIRRILKSKWKPSEEEAEDRRARWEKRGVKKWQDMAQQGARPPSKWRARGVRSTNKEHSERKRQAATALTWDEVVGRKFTHE